MLRKVQIFISSLFYWLPIIRHNIACRKNFLLPLYRAKDAEMPFAEKASEEKLVVYMVLKETTFSGGLSDRLRAITAIYKQCRQRNLPFRIVFEPLHLEDYLQPNMYDWRIDAHEVCYDTNKSYPCTLLTYHASTKDRYQHFVQNTILAYYLKKDYRQIHVYSNMICKDEEYGLLFKELFKPSPELQQQIDYHLSKIGGDETYISVTFRFRQLLGDFKEGGDTLPSSEREYYIERCLHCIERLHASHPNERILVTADSSTFLRRVSEDAGMENYVYLIPGEVVHIGFTFDAQKKTYMKSFVDYYMLSYAKCVYLVRDKKMYHSGFPYRAALLNNREYREVKL